MPTWARWRNNVLTYSHIYVNTEMRLRLLVQEALARWLAEEV
jgi:hypothetical protein